MNLYVGNLPKTITEDELYMAFKTYGQVTSATIVRDKFTREVKGFGFVDMPVKTEAQAAMEAMNGSTFQGQVLKVNEARPKEERPRGNFRGGHSGGGSGGGGFRGGRR